MAANKRNNLLVDTITEPTAVRVEGVREQTLYLLIPDVAVPPCVVELPGGLPVVNLLLLPASQLVTM